MSVVCLVLPGQPLREGSRLSTVIWLVDSQGNKS